MEVERMTESLSKYRLPTSQMEDVPIGDLYSEKSTESKPQYGRCILGWSILNFFFYFVLVTENSVRYGGKKILARPP